MRALLVMTFVLAPLALAAQTPPTGCEQISVRFLGIENDEARFRVCLIEGGNCVVMRLQPGATIEF